MKITIKFSYTEEIIPPRCKNPRRTAFDDGVLKFNVIESYGSNAPVAIVSKCTDEQRNGPDVEYRLFKGKLWTKIRVSEAEPRSYSANKKSFEYVALATEIDFRTNSTVHGGSSVYGIYYYSSHSKKEVEASIKAQLREFLIVDGVFHRRASEPRYVAMTFGIGANHGGTSVVVSDNFNPNIKRSAYFGLLEKEAALKYGAMVASLRNDTKSLPMVVTGRSFEVFLSEAVKIRNKMSGK